ncbi:DNA-binding response regulator [Sphingobacteriaceae bacterium]|nr:DNA-binding response regulator [Sphingobacteriaceae bacterium]
MNNAEILIIDDEAQIQKLLKITLQTNDFKVTGALTAQEGLRAAKNINPDLILLDLGLPDKSGHDVLKELREWYTKPIIILSVQSAEEDIVKALDNGANDYLVKPFRTGELLARLRALLRFSLTPPLFKPLALDELDVDPQLRLVKKKGEIIKLTATEYDLLTTLIRNEGRVLTHQYLLREVWGPGYIEQSQYLRVFVNQLRKKIEAEPNQPKYIITESGVGYRFISKENHS